MRVTHVFCDGCGAKIIFDPQSENNESVFSLSLFENANRPGVPIQFRISEDNGPPELCETCGELIKTLLTNKSLRKVVMGNEKLSDIVARDSSPIPMLLDCPKCHERHIDEGAFATRAHHTHACQHCGMVWRPAIACTVGVQFLPNFKNPE